MTHHENIYSKKTTSGSAINKINKGKIKTIVDGMPFKIKLTQKLWIQLKILILPLTFFVVKNHSR